MTTPTSLDEIYRYIIVNDLDGEPPTDITLGNVLLALGAAIANGTKGPQGFQGYQGNQGASGGGGGGAVTLIASSVLVAPAPTFDFSAIPGTFNHLELLVVASSSAAASYDNFTVQVNGDTGLNYDGSGVDGSYGDVPNANQVTNTSWQDIGYADLTAAQNTAGVPGSLRLFIPMYAQSVFQKLAQWDSGYSDIANIDVGSPWFLQRQQCLWRNTDPITSLAIAPLVGPDFIVGSAAYLYGIT